MSLSDKLLTANHLVQWGLIGAASYGAASSIILPISLLSSLGSEILSFCSLPKDASWLRTALSIPVLSKLLINYNPWVAKLFQATSLYNLVDSSAEKLATIWDAFQSNPKRALKNGAVHLFNIASSIAFALGIAKPRLDPKARTIIKRPQNPGIIDRLTISNQCPRRAVVNPPGYDLGMFSVTHFIVGILDQFEQGKYSGVQVNTGNQGAYYDPAHGENWFEYYFEPIDLVDKDCINAPPKSFSKTPGSFNGAEYGQVCSYVDNSYGYDDTGMPTSRTRELLQKYLIVKPEIQKEADQFAKTHFSESDYIVGVHYRGTDKACNTNACEARRVSYEEMTSNIQKFVENLPLKNREATKILVASDEENFVQHLSKEFPGRVIASPAKRSIDGKPLHIKAKDPYQSGKESVIDFHLLSKFPNALIRTSSNLSRIAGLLLKEGAPVVEVSKAYYRDPAKSS